MPLAHESILTGHLSVTSRAAYTRYCRNTIGQVSIETLNALSRHATSAKAHYIMARQVKFQRL